MGTLGRANRQVLFCLGESVTPKGKDGIREAYADGKRVQFFGSMGLTEMIGLKKFGRINRN
jgi:hypothetical protein